MANGSEHVSAKDNRPLPARLDAYIANLQSINNQVKDLVAMLEFKNAQGGEFVYDTESLQAVHEIQGHIIDDLIQVVNGEQLTPFRIEATL